MKLLVYIALLLSLKVSAQETRGLILGNTVNLCIADSTFSQSDSLPQILDSFQVIYFFSNSTSNLSQEDLNRLEMFIVEGGGLYTGSDNWPLQAEANQITREFYQKESFGNYEADLAQSNGSGKLNLHEIDSIPAGKTTAAFPLDYRLTVEAWVDDQPLILTGSYGKGNIVIDTGYSRFYCDERNKNSDALFERIYLFLIKEEE